MKSGTASKILRTVSRPEAFMFYTDIHQYTGKLAYSLPDFLDELQNVPLRSVEFHFQRGDFQRWFEGTLGDASLAHDLTQLGKTLHGEELRKAIDELVQQHLKELMATVTQAETKTVPPTEETQAHHETLVKAMIRHLQDNENFTMVRADVEGYESPDPINGYTPDIVAIKPDERCFVEAETCKTLVNPQTDVRWNALAQAALRTNTRFDIIVPKQCEEKAIEKRRKLGIKAKIWQISLS